MTATGIRRPDSDTRDDVLRELAWDSRIGDKQVGVQVSSGLVTLAGTVDSWAVRKAAVEAAHRVAGVLDVADELDVNPAASGAPSDTEIARAVRHALEWDALVPNRQIRSTVSDGIVTLEGAVARHQQREDAESAVARLKGVRRIDNQIAIQPCVAVEDVESAIRQALKRRAAREVNELQLHVAEGKVTVAGAVTSANERRAVLGAICGTRGVESVEDRLRVEPR